jgi:dihydrolipoamide dehydrogenase
VPKSLLMIGAGAVGVEFASIFNRFGSQVTVLSKCCRASCRWKTRKFRRNWSATSRRPASVCETGAKAENITKTENGVKMRSRFRTANGRCGGREAAGGGGPQAEHG